MQISETPRLSLHEFTLADAPFILALLNSPGWLQFIGDFKINDVEAAENYLRNRPLASYASNGFGLYLVRTKENNAAVGASGLIKRNDLPFADIGFAQLPEYNGYGYALEAATAVRDMAFRELKMPELGAITLPRNGRSIRLLEKLGMALQGPIRLSHTPEELMLWHMKAPE